MRPAQKRVLVVGLVLLALVPVFLFNPAKESFFPPCPFHSLTGLDCPGCGSTRGLHALLHGHIIQAEDYNVLLIPGLIFIFLSFAKDIEPRLTGLWSWFNRPRLTLWIVCAFWILRNIPFGPLRWLSASV